MSWTRRSSRRTGKPTWPNEEDGRKLVAVLGTGRVPKVALPGGAAEGPAATGFESPSHAEAQQRAQAYGARITEHHRGADQNQNGEGGNGDLPLEILGSPLHFGASDSRFERVPSRTLQGTTNPPTLGQ